MEIAHHYNQRLEQVQIERWAADPDRHPKRTPKAVQVARTTWRWGCTILAALLLLCCAASLTSLALGSMTPVTDLGVTLVTGSAAAVPLGWRETVPGWYLKSVEQMDRDGSC